MLWHALGAKTVELINENIHVESVRDDVETLVMDAQVLEGILKDADPEKKGKEMEIKLHCPAAEAPGQSEVPGTRRTAGEDQGAARAGLPEQSGVSQGHARTRQGRRRSREARLSPEEERDKAKEALTELFKEAKTGNTHIIVERIVNDIDEIVKKVRFPDWQHTSAGERLVQKELRRTLLKYKLHTDQELFDRAYGYIRQYY